MRFFESQAEARRQTRRLLLLFALTVLLLVVAVNAALALAWGLSWAATAIALREVPPWSLRFAGAGIGTVTLFAAALMGGHSLKVPRGEYKHIMIAGFLNVFTGRLARVADRVNAIVKSRHEGQPLPPQGLSANVTSLRRRTLALQGAVLLCSASGIFTCAATFTIFVGALGAEFGSVLLFEFGLSLLCLLGAIAFFLAEMYIATRAMFDEIAKDR